MEENHSWKGHKRQDFLVERIAFFSDAVFAIGITLMILDIHPPVLQRGDTTSMVWNKIGKEVPEFMALVISYLLIGTTWLRHHQLFRYMDGYDMKFLVTNLCLLFTIILFPFSTSFLSKTLFEDIVTKPQVIIYLAVPLLSNWILYLMFIQVRKRHMSSKADKSFHFALIDQKYLIVSFIVALAWMIFIPIQYHYYAYALLGLGPVLSLFVKKNKKYKNMA